MEKCDSESIFDVNDILEKMQPDLDKWKEVKYQILEKEEKIKQMNEEKERRKAEYEFELEKQKLDKAFEMNILTQLEYDYKLGMAKMKLDNYELLRKYDLQLQMGILTKEEYDEKIKETELW